MSDDGTGRETRGPEPQPEGLAGTPPQYQPADAETQQQNAQDAGDRLSSFSDEKVVMEIEQPKFGPFPHAAPAIDQGAILSKVGTAAIAIDRLMQSDFLTRESDAREPRV